MRQLLALFSRADWLSLKRSPKGVIPRSTYAGRCGVAARVAGVPHEKAQHQAAVQAGLVPRDAQPELALRYDGRRRCFSLSPNRVLAFARAAGNAQCQCQRTNDSEEFIHSDHPPGFPWVYGNFIDGPRTSAEKPQVEENKRPALLRLNANDPADLHKVVAVGPKVGTASDGGRGLNPDVTC